MSEPRLESIPALDRREQILTAAMVCFAKRGFHQASMHDISAEAGISVGLIYRYFENKDAVISAMADNHKREIQQVLERARQAPSARALEVLFNRPLLRELAPGQLGPLFDLFAEAAASRLRQLSPIFENRHDGGLI